MEQKKIPPDRPESGRELGSWKEIAHHLGVNVRTAQKWERERGMPVQRSSGVRGRVASDPASLDAWKRKSAALAAPSDRCYRWPLGQGLTVEVRFLNGEPCPADIDLLRGYLDLFKTSLGQFTP